MVSGYIEAGQVAAALMTKSGNIYTGICIDTACSLGMCAERNAIAHMLTCGESEIRKLAVVMSDGTMSLPCGACCEFMMQLGQWAGEIEILIDYQKAEVRHQNIPFPTTSLIFMWIIAGRGCRGTGWAGLEHRCSTGFTALSTVSGR